MDLELIGALIRLRYKLLWAKTRTRNGKIALFMSGYLLLVFVLVVLAAGGFGAGMVAVRSGKAEWIARAVLSGLFLNALMAAIILGFGMNAVFSDAALRRYPLQAIDRLAARHLIGMLDPFWYLFLALELGLAIGLYALGAGGFWVGVAAVLLLFVSNYLCARVLGLLVERLMARRAGAAVLLALILLLSLLPAAVTPALRKHPEALEPVIRVLSFTPPFGAAAAMTGAGMKTLFGVALLICWLVGLTLALVTLERRPVETRAAQSTTISWESNFERLGSFFGPPLATLIAHWLRFYSRNNRFRTVFAIALPLAAFLMISWGRRGVAPAQFAAALSAFAILGCMGGTQAAVNQFGYVDTGFRRLLLMPVRPADVLRASSYTLLLVNATLIPVGTLVFVIVRPIAFDARMLVMLVGMAVTGLFLLHGLGLWATVLGPRRADYYSSFGNDLSALGNVVVLGGMLSLMFVPQILAQAAPNALAPDYWWILVVLAVTAAAFYFVSLRRTGAMLLLRRESLLCILEGRR